MDKACETSEQIQAAGEAEELVRNAFPLHIIFQVTITNQNHSCSCRNHYHGLHVHTMQYYQTQYSQKNLCTFAMDVVIASH